MPLWSRVKRWLSWQRYLWLERRRGKGCPVAPVQWDREYASGGWERLRSVEELGHYALVAAYIGRLGSGGRVLDVGCGEGILLDYLSGGMPLTYLGVDLSAEAIAQAAARTTERARFEAMDVACETPDGEYDAIVLNEVLYYFDDPLAVAGRLAGRLAPAGVLIVSMASPSGDHIWPRLMERFVCVDRNRVQNASGVCWSVGAFHRETPR